MQGKHEEERLADAWAFRLLRIDAINACGLAKPSRYNQNELLELIGRFVQRNGYEPTAGEIRAIACGDFDPESGDYAESDVAP